MAGGKERPQHHPECPLCGDALQMLHASLNGEHRPFLSCAADDAAWDVVSLPSRSSESQRIRIAELYCSTL